MENYTRKSLAGLWVGDCIGNLGQLYFVHDILKALETGLAKFGGQLNQFQKQFRYSDDTEEAIVLYNHLLKARLIGMNSPEFNSRAPDLIEQSEIDYFRNRSYVNQDELAMEFATRYMERDPDGEIYGYGLNTRKVLRDIYEGVSWTEANKIIKKSEGMPSHIDSLVDSLSKGKGFQDAMKDVNKALEQTRKETQGKEKEGSCGNGSAMRIAPLGAFLAERWHTDEESWGTGKKLCYYEKKVVVEAALSAEVTHCHPEGKAGAIAIATLSQNVAEAEAKNYSDKHVYFQNLLRCTPEGQVRDGIIKAQSLPFDTPLMKAVETLGNGTHVTCQDTVPLCCWLAVKHLYSDDKSDMYEKAIIETSMAFGDVDTNCAIVGGIVGIVSPPPEKWSKFCQPMEGIAGE